MRATTISLLALDLPHNHDSLVCWLASTVFLLFDASMMPSQFAKSSFSYPVLVPAVYSPGSSLIDDQWLFLCIHSCRVIDFHPKLRVCACMCKRVLICSVLSLPTIFCLSCPTNASPCLWRPRLLPSYVVFARVRWTATPLLRVWLWIMLGFELEP